MRARTRRGDLGDRLDRADLVVGEHDRDEDRLVVEGRLELVGVDAAVAVDRQLDDLEPELLEVAQGVADRVVLDRRGHDPVAARLAGPGGALEREVVRLGPAGREDDLAALRVEPRRDALVGVVERRPGRPPVAVRRARVAERLGQERQHRVEDLAPERRRRGVVEVDRHGPDRTPDPCAEPARRLAGTGATLRSRRRAVTAMTNVHATTGHLAVSAAARPGATMAPRTEWSPTVPAIVIALIVVIPLVALALGVIDTRRANARIGIPPVEFTYRAYSA